MRSALKSFRSDPGIIGLAVLILALGIGANTAVFSLVNPLLLRPLPLADADRLVWIANTGTTGMSGATYRVDVLEEFVRRSTSMEDIRAYFAFSGFFSRTLDTQGQTERLAAVDVAPGFLELLGVRPAVGRLFVEGDHRGPMPPALLLTHGFWIRRFAGDPSIVGRSVTINAAAAQIVGVLPSSFDFASIFTPGAPVDVVFPADLNQMRPWGNTLALVGKRRPGVTLEQARAEFATILPAIAAARPELGRPGARLEDLQAHVGGPVRRSVTVLWGAVGVVLLIACANVTNLLLVRASSRRREFAVRGALGAGRGRLFRQVLTEGLLLAGAGAALGVPLAFALTTWLTRSDGVSIPMLQYASVDIAALTVTAIIACAAGLAGSVLPAWRLSGQDPQTALGEHGRGTVDPPGQVWTRRVLVCAEVALAVVLLVGAGLLGRSLMRVVTADVGFDAQDAAVARLDMPPAASPIDQTALRRRVLERVLALPGVSAAGFTDALPLDRNRTWGVTVPGQTYGPGEVPSTFVYVVSPGYMPAMGIPVLAGRDFVHDDPMTERQPVIVNRTLARTLFPDQDPIGRPAQSNGIALTIVGVVESVRQSSLEESPVHQMYLDMSRVQSVGADLVVRSAMGSRSLAPALRGALADVGKGLVVANVSPMSALVDRAVSPRRFLAEIIGGFSLFAVILASLGIYGVVSYHVRQRTTEIGVRMALGATASVIRRAVVADALVLAGVGVVAGGGAAWLLSATVTSLLYATSSTDPVVFGVSTVALVAVAGVAAFIPALRASRISPSAALRAD